MDKILIFFNENIELISLLFSGCLVPILYWLLKRLRNFISIKTGKINKEVIDAYFSRTEKLIEDKLWRFDPSKNQPTTKGYIPLSANVSESERIPPIFIKKIANLPAGKTISNLNKFIKKNQKNRIPFAITGAPGSGKTFELVKLFYDYKKTFKGIKNWLPILVFINEIQSDIFKLLTGKHALKEFIISYLEKTGYPNEVIHFFRKSFYKLKLLFLFDALDEIPDKDDYNFALERIREFIKKVELNKWCFFLSCRTEDYDSKLDLIILEIQPLSSKQIELFFKKKRFPNSLQEKLRIKAWERFIKSENLWFQPYISNPYFLAIMLDSIENSILGHSNLENVEIPINMRELFRSSLKKELFKISNSKMSVNFFHIFESFCSIVAFFLIEKTSEKENASFDIMNDDDLLSYFKTCILLKEKRIEPFHSIFNFTEHIFAATGEDLINYSISSAKLGKFLEYRDIGNLIITIIGDLKGDFENNENLLKKNIKNLKLYSNINIDSLVKKAIQVISNLTNREVEFAFYYISFIVYSLIIDIGLERRLLRLDPFNNSAITGFRHRRLLEYFGSNYIDLAKINFSGKIKNLWYKQTMCILSAITTDLDWFFQELNVNKSDNLFAIADIIQFVHPHYSERKRKYFDEVIANLHLVLVKNESLSQSYKSLKGIYNIILSGHWTPPKFFAERIVTLAKQIPLFHLCLKILILMDNKNSLDKKIYYNFIRKCLRNVLSVNIVKGKI